MSSYELTFYSREDVTFGRDDDGNFTVTVNEGATPDTIKIVDNDRDGEDTFSGSTRAGPTDQQAYGTANDTEFDGDPIQPLAALPGLDNADQQVMAIGVGDPMHTTGYSFNFTPVIGEPMSFNYDGYISAPSYPSDELYVEGEADSDPDGDSSSASSGGSTSSGASGASGGGSGSSTPSGASGASGGGSGSSTSSGASGASGGGSESSTPSGASGASGGGSGSSTPSGTSGPSGGGSGPSSPPCFTRGTAIRTARGELLVEELVIGDMVWTEAHGPQPIRWIFQREVEAKGVFAPIRICAGALGADRDILVSPAHRMLISGLEIELLFGIHKVLAAAKDLVNDHNIYRETALESVEYFHILFDQHEVLQAHGTLSESFYPYGAAIDDFGDEQRAELFALFPELEFEAQSYSIAYPSLRAHELAMIAR